MAICFCCCISSVKQGCLELTCWFLNHHNHPSADASERKAGYKPSMIVYIHTFLSLHQEILKIIIICLYKQLDDNLAKI